MAKKPKPPAKPWTVITKPKHDKDVENLTPAAQEKYHTFIGKINEGKHPKKAAEETGDMDYMQMNDGSGRHKVRLDGKERLTGVEGDETDTHRTFHIFEVGGHT